MARFPPRENARHTRWAWWLATFFGAGFLRPGPGTYASITAVLLWLAAAHWLHPATTRLALGTLMAAGVATLIGIPAATRVAREAGREDPGFVVIDEVAGQWFSLVALPGTLIYGLLGLLLFRLFDIWKPWPVRRLETLPDGTGIMLDDVAAGVLALTCAHLLIRLGGLLH